MAKKCASVPKNERVLKQIFDLYLEKLGNVEHSNYEKGGYMQFVFLSGEEHYTIRAHVSPNESCETLNIAVVNEYQQFKERMSKKKADELLEKAVAAISDVENPEVDDLQIVNDEVEPAEGNILRFSVDVERMVFYPMPTGDVDDDYIDKLDSFILESSNEIFRSAFHQFMNTIDEG